MRARLATKDRVMAWLIVSMAAGLLGVIWWTVEANRNLLEPHAELTLSRIETEEAMEWGEVQVVAADGRPVKDGRIVEVNADSLLDPDFGGTLPGAELAETLDGDGVRPGLPAVVAGEDPRRKALVYWALRAVGLDEVGWLQGGVELAGALRGDAWGSGMRTGRASAGGGRQGGPDSPASDGTWSFEELAPAVAVDSIELYSSLGSAEMFLVDARDPKMYAAGHLPGAVNIPAASLYESDPFNLVPATVLMGVMRKIPSDRRVVVYGDGLDAAWLWWFFHSRGLMHVRLWGGSFNLWEASGFPTESSPELLTPVVPTRRIGGGCG